MSQKNVKISVVTPTIRPQGLEVLADCLKKQTFKEFEWLVEINVSGETDFNNAMNKMIKRAQGSLIVSIQDYTRIPNDGLENMWKDYEDKPAFYTYPLSKQMADGSIKTDWRTHREEKKCNFMEWEIDCGSAPKKWLINIGGFDEYLDEYWGFDNVNVGLRADKEGYPILLSHSTEALALDHDSFMEHPFREKRNPEFHNKRLDDIRKGNFTHFL